MTLNWTKIWSYIGSMIQPGTAEYNEVADMYNPQLWPAGIYVHRYYKARKPRATNGSEACGSVCGINL